MKGGEGEWKRGKRKMERERKGRRKYRQREEG